MATSVNRHFRRLVPAKDTLLNEQSRKRQRSAMASSKAPSANSTPSYSPSGSRSPPNVVSGTCPTLPAQVGQHGQHPPVVLRGGQQAELGEHVPDVGLHGLG